MTTQTLTAALLALTTVFLIAYDVWAKLKVKSGDATISWVLLTAAKSYPVIAFAIGFVMGHIFFQNCQVP